MKLPRRQFLHLAAGAAAGSAVPAIAIAQTDPKRPPSETPGRPLAERLAAYADKLRYDDIDAATVERVKSHVIDVLGCGIAAFDEPPVRVCRDVALAPSGGATAVIASEARRSRIDEHRTFQADSSRAPSRTLHIELINKEKIKIMNSPSGPRAAASCPSPLRWRVAEKCAQAIEKAESSPKTHTSAAPNRGQPTRSQTRIASRP